MNAYAKGANAERAFIKMLLKGATFQIDMHLSTSRVEHWEPALWSGRTAGSHSKIDVTGWWPDVVRGFQIKRGGAVPEASEIAYLRGLALATRGLAECYVVRWPDRCPPHLFRVK